MSNPLPEALAPFHGAMGAPGYARHPQTPGTFGPLNPRSVVLPEGYYHTHFLSLVGTVLGRYDDLLTAEERAFAGGFLALPPTVQMLYVRLVNRVGPWFRVAKLCYGEVGDCPAAVEILKTAGLASGEANCPLDDALALLTAVELKRLFPEFKGKGSRTRDELEDACREHFSKEDVLRRALFALGPLVSPRHADTVRLFQFLYFGNAAQNMTDFVLADMGLMRYESYPFDASTRAFECREALQHSLEARDAYEELFVALEENREDWEVEALVEARDAALTRLATFHPRAQRRLYKTLNLLGNRLERKGKLDLAFPCYENNPLPPARERTVRLLCKRGDTERATTIALDALVHSRDEDELAFAYRHLVKSVGLPIDTLPLPEEERVGLTSFLKTKSSLDLWPQRKMVLPRILKKLGVEGAVLYAASDEGFEGFHCENLLWRALFGIVFWEQVFAGIPGVFHHPYQVGPTDAQSSDFFPARETACLETLTRFANEAGSPCVIEGLQRRWRAKEGLANPWIHWAGLTWEAMEVFIRATPRNGLVTVLRRMLRHPGRFDSGFPDLFLVKEGRAHFWEVKGPGDQLRPEQKAWLARMHASGISVAVCVVEYD